MAAKVMVIDDSSVMRKIVARTLRASGLQIGELMEGASGEEGLKFIQEGHLPDLIVSDVNMGGMDGISFVREARRVLPRRQTRILMVTTESGQARISEAMSAGADAFITKPFTPEQFAENLGALL